MRFYLKVIAAIILTLIVIFLVFVTIRWNEKVACTPGEISVNILVKNYPNLEGKICNIETEGVYRLQLVAGDKGFPMDLGSSKMIKGDNYFSVNFGGESEWASPKTGNYEVRLLSKDSIQPIAVSKVFLIENTSKVEISDFNFLPEKPEKNQKVVISWKSINAEKCILNASKNAKEQLSKVGESYGSGSIEFNPEVSTYFELICLGKGARVGGRNLEGNFSRENKWLLVNK